MADKVSDAAMGTGEAAESIKQLNLNAAQLNKLKPDEQFEAIADAMQGITNQGDKVRIAMDLFGGRGVSLIQAMEGGATSIRALREEAVALGISLSQDDADGAAKANDAMARLKATSTALSVTLARELQGPIGDISDKLTAAAIASGGFQTEIKTAIKGGLGALATMVETTDSVVEYFDSRPYLATTGIVGYMVFGKKGVAGIMAAQFVVDKIGESMLAIQQNFTGEGLLIADPAKIDEAKKKLDFLQESYDIHHRQRLFLRQELESANEKSAKIELEAQKRLIMGMETMQMSGRTLNNNWTKSEGILSGVVQILRDAQASVDAINSNTTSGLLAGIPNPHIGEIVPPVVDPPVIGEDTKNRFERLSDRLKSEEQRLADSVESTGDKNLVH